MPHRRTLSSLLLGAAAALPLSTHAAPGYRYEPIVLVPFTPGQGSGVAKMINNSGTICGTASGSPGAFCWRDGRLIALKPLPGDEYAEPESINEKGEVVGSSYDVDTDRRRAVVFVDGAAHELPVAVHASSTAMDINDAGDIVGAYSDRLGDAMAYVIRQGTVRDLGTLGQTVRASVGAGIDNRGQVVGSSTTDQATPFGQFRVLAFSDRRDTLTALPTPPEHSSHAARVNARGQTVGFIERDNGGAEGYRAVLWDADGMHVLSDLPSDARGINNRGQVVGSVQTAPGGFLYEPGKGSHNLNDLIDPAAGLTFVYPQAINERGQIVGYGCQGESCGPMLLDPVGD
jgi:probable HAF family extracellular repeat protein